MVLELRYSSALLFDPFRLFLVLDRLLRVAKASFAASLCRGHEVALLNGVVRGNRCIGELRLGGFGIEKAQIGVLKVGR